MQRSTIELVLQIKNEYVYSGGFWTNTLQINQSVLESRYCTLQVTNLPFRARSRSCTVFSSYCGFSGSSTFAITILSMFPYSSLLSLRKCVTDISKVFPDKHAITGPP